MRTERIYIQSSLIGEIQCDISGKRYKPDNITIDEFTRVKQSRGMF